ncbi:hypothetical protein [Humibacter soli]
MLAIETSSGRLTGRWMGDGTVPVGEVLSLGLELARPHTWAEISGVNTNPGGVDLGAGRVHGTVELAFEDGVLAVRIGEAVTQLEVLGEVPADAIGALVLIPEDDIEHCPTGA